MGGNPQSRLYFSSDSAYKAQILKIQKANANSKAHRSPMSNRRRALPRPILCGERLPVGMSDATGLFSIKLFSELFSQVFRVL